MNHFHFFFQRYNCGFKAKPIMLAKYLGMGVPLTLPKAKAKAKTARGIERIMAKAVLKNVNSKKQITPAPAK